MTITVDGKPPPLTGSSLEVEEQDHTILCTVMGFNPNTTHLDVQILVGKEVLFKTTQPTIEPDSDASVAARAPRYR